MGLIVLVVALVVMLWCLAALARPPRDGESGGGCGLWFPLVLVLVLVAFCSGYSG